MASRAAPGLRQADERAEVLTSVTDASDPQAEGLYERFGSVKVTDGHPCRMILDLRPLLEPPSP